MVFEIGKSSSLFALSKQAGRFTALLMALAASSAGDAWGAMHTARAADEFVDSIGVNVHLAFTNTPYYREFSKIRAALVTLGVRHIRDNVVFSHDVYERGPVVERWVALAGDGIKTTLIGDMHRPPADLVSLALRAGSAVEALEGPNEYDLSQKADWVVRTRAYQVGLFGAAKGRRSGFAVIAPSLARFESFRQLGDLSAFSDFGNIHSYPGGGGPPEAFDRHLSQSKWVASNKPLMATETGYHNALQDRGNHAPVSPAAEAKYTPRLLFHYFNAGINRTFLYQLHDAAENMDGNDREAHFGLLAYDFTPKPVYRALANCIALLRDAGPAFQPAALEYEIRGDTPDLRSTLLQKRDGRFFLALWLEKSVFDRRARRNLPNAKADVFLVFPKPVAGVRLFAPGEGIGPVQTWAAAREIRLSVPDEVVLVEVTVNRP